MTSHHPFTHTAAYYDLLYRHKDYRAESSFIHSVIRSSTKIMVPHVLDLGCGTARHIRELHRLGDYRFAGIDASKEMVREAKKALADTGVHAEIRTGDIRSFRHDVSYDAVLSLFHVASYMRTDEDMLSFIRSAAESLKEEGVFIFDYWYEPGIFHTPPETRTLIRRDGDVVVERTKTPTVFPDSGIVEVIHTLRITEKGVVRSAKKERHILRYYSMNKIRSLLESLGLSVRAWGALSGNRLIPPADDEWSVWVIAAKT